MPKRIRKILARPATDSILLGLILLWNLVLILEIVSSDPVHQRWLAAAGVGLSLVFCVELGLRYAVATTRSRFFREYWLDLVAVIPAAAIPGLQALRLLRLLRILRLFRGGVLLMNRFTRVSAAISGGSGEILLAGVVVLMVCTFGAAGMFYAEREAQGPFKTFPDAIWYTLYTVVAGQPIEAPPYTTTGRVITLVLVVAGMSIFVLFTGVANALVSERLRRHLEASPMDLEMLEDHIVICGWSSAGYLLIGQIQRTEAGDTAIAVISEEELRLRERVPRPELVYPVRGDPTRLDVLRSAGAERARFAIVLADQGAARSEQDRDARSMLTAVMLEKLNPRIQTCVELLNADNEGHLRMAGVEDIVIPSDWSAHLMSTLVTHRAITRAHEELLDRNRGNSFYVIDCPAWARGLPFVEAVRRMKAEQDMILVGVETCPEAVAGGAPRGESDVVLNPPAERPIGPADKLIVMSRTRPKG